MKNPLLALLFIISLVFSNSASSQLANSNMYLLKQLNAHHDYAALWGYLAPNDREYAIMGCFDGTVFADLTDSATIRQVAFLPATSTNYGNYWREMKTYSHYAYIVSEAQNSALQIVDLQYLPDSIRYVGKFTLPGHSSTHSISQEGPYLYLNGCNSSFVPNGGIAVLDLSVNPEVPVLRGKWTSRYVHDCRVRNDTIYASNINDGHITIINDQNKDNLTTITDWLNNPNPAPHNNALTYDRKYMLTTDENPTGKLKVWNIENTSNPVLHTSWQPTGITTAIVHNVEIYGKYALIAHYTAGVRLVDISNPLVPTEVAWYDTYPSNINDYEGCWAVYMFPSGKIIASDITYGLFVLKTTFPLNTGVEQVSAEIPQSFSLSQNYPNPFNPTTVINYQCSKAGIVSLKVFDVNGKLITTLVNKRQDAGSYSANFDGKDLSSGIYFYTLSTADFTETKKMILMK